MQTEIAEVIFEKVKILPLDKQQEVLKIVEQKIEQNEPDNQRRPIWEVAKEISSQIPNEEWQKLPADGSVNHDYYLYGAPKKY